MFITAHSVVVLSASVLILAGLAKARNRSALDAALSLTGFPDWTLRAAFVIPVVELSVGALALVPSTAWIGSMAAAVMCVQFTSWHVGLLRTGMPVSCGCFGRTGGRANARGLALVGFMATACGYAAVVLSAAVSYGEQAVVFCLTASVVAAILPFKIVSRASRERQVFRLGDIVACTTSGSCSQIKSYVGGQKTILVFLGVHCHACSNVIESDWGRWLRLAMSAPHTKLQAVFVLDSLSQARRLPGEFLQVAASDVSRVRLVATPSVVVIDTDGTLMSGPHFGRPSIDEVIAASYS